MCPIHSQHTEAYQQDTNTVFTYMYMYVHRSGMCPAVVCAQQWYVSSSGDMMPPTNDAAELVILIAQHRTSNWLRVAPTSSNHHHICPSCLTTNVLDNARTSQYSTPLSLHHHFVITTSSLRHRHRQRVYALLIRPLDAHQ